jgi:hypothetical protein
MVAAVLPSQPGLPYKNYASVSAIEIRWTEPLSDGGSNITDYLVYWDEGRGTNEFVQIANTIGYLTYTIDAVKSPEWFMGGAWYQFYVSAVNIIGESVYSDIVTVLAAEVPDQPDPPSLVS